MNNNLNLLIFNNYQKKYTNLVDFVYNPNNDTLSYKGKAINLNGYGLSFIDPVFFKLSPMDIFAYFKNGFYYDSKDSEAVENLLGQIVITIEEKEYLNFFAQKYMERRNLYARNQEFFKENMENNQAVKNFVGELLKGNEIINKASEQINLGSNAASILTDAINSNHNSNTNVLENNNSLEDSNNLEKGMTLTRKKEGFNGFDEEAYLQELENKQKLGVAGFTSMILIIASVVTFGIYLALKIMP